MPRSINSKCSLLRRERRKRRKRKIQREFAFRGENSGRRGRKREIDILLDFPSKDNVCASTTINTRLHLVSTYYFPSTACPRDFLSARAIVGTESTGTGSVTWWCKTLKNSPILYRIPIGPPRGAKNRRCCTRQEQKTLNSLGVTASDR